MAVGGQEEEGHSRGRGLPDPSEAGGLVICFRRRPRRGGELITFEHFPFQFFSLHISTNWNDFYTKF